MVKKEEINMNIYKNVTELIGNTKLMELTNIEKDLKLKSRIFVKLEYLNPTGSVKDRIAKAMILDAVEKGKLEEGGTIIEPTSGNTGIGIASVATSLGIHSIIVMPETMSKERQQMIASYGAKIVLTEGKKGMQGSIDKANELNKEIKGSIILGQFNNEVNPEAHYKTTGPEIYRDLDSKVDIFIAGIGTGGTLSGTGKYLKEQNKNIKVIGIEPFSSPLISEGHAGPHKIQGIGANFIPATLDKNIYDELKLVKDEDAYSTCKYIASKEGILLGVSSGAAIFVAIKEAKESTDKNIVVIAPDGGDRYFSLNLYA